MCGDACDFFKLRFIVMYTLTHGRIPQLKMNTNFISHYLMLDYYMKFPVVRPSVISLGS